MLLIADAEKSLFLCGSCCRGWTPPELLLESEVTCYSAARAFMSAAFGDIAFRFGEMRGRFWPSPVEGWECDRRTALTVLIIRLETSRPDRVGHLNDGRHVWWGQDQLLENRRHIYPPGIVSLIDGYFDGRLPDGDLRLE